MGYASAMFWRSAHLEGGFRLRGRTLAGGAPLDGLSVLRAARLVAEHLYRLDAGLEADLRRVAAAQAAGGTEGRTLEIQGLEITERRDGLSAILLAANAAEGIAVLDRVGALAAYLPELEAARGVDQFGGFHHLDVLGHSIEALRRLTATFPDAALETRWAALLHDVGKPPSRSWDAVRERWSFFGHDGLGGRIARDLLSRLAYPADTVERASLMVDRHMLRLPGDEASAKRFARRNARILPDLLAVMLADREAARGPLSTEGTRRAYQRGMDLVLGAMRDLETRKPILDGEAVMAHLGLAPGKLVGEALEVLRQASDAGEVSTPEEARARLDAWAREIGLAP